MKKTSIIFLLFSLQLFGKWEIIETKYAISLSKYSLDKKAEIIINYSREHTYYNIIVISEKEIKEDVKIVVEYKYYDGKKKIDDKNYYIDEVNSVIRNIGYSDLSFNGYFSLATTLTVYANKKKIHTFDLEDLTKLLIFY